MSKMIKASLWGMSFHSQCSWSLESPFFHRGAVLLKAHSLPSLFTHTNRDCIVKILSFYLDMDWTKGALYMV